LSKPEINIYAEIHTFFLLKKNKTKFHMVIDFDKVQWAILTKNAIFIHLKLLNY